MKFKFAVILNDKYFGDIAPNKESIKIYLRKYLKSTHMGQLIKTSKGYQYSTTIGRYYEFIKYNPEKEEIIHVPAIQNLGE